MRPARRRKAPAWSKEELAILRKHYPTEGLNGVADLLGDRSWQSIRVKAWRLGIRSTATNESQTPKLAGAELEEAIRLREEERWSFARIGGKFGVCEASASNAVIMALCTRKGFRPAERDHHGRLTEEGTERIRLMLRKGLKSVEIQLRLGISASCITKARQKYERDLKARGKAALPPPGGGERYSGVRVPPATKREVERLYLEGFGAAKISDRTGVSKTHCLRIRTKLIKRLRRNGETLPGCDRAGIRRAFKDSARKIPDETKIEFRRRLLEGEPVRSAAHAIGLGLSNGYRIRDALVAELALEGKELPRLNWRTRPKDTKPPPAIAGAKIFRFRALCRTMPTDQASAIVLEEFEAERRREAEEIGGAIAAFARAVRDAVLAERRRPKTFEEQLAAVAQGATLAPAFRPIRRGPDFTIGGVATGAIG